MGLLNSLFPEQCSSRYLLAVLVCLKDSLRGNQCAYFGFFTVFAVNLLKAASLLLDSLSRPEYSVALDKTYHSHRWLSRLFSEDFLEHSIGSCSTEGDMHY